jgi:2-desacetyl-2-hydroxyethyl bacteriochlorophyllide A dehydrogenase
MMGKKVSALWFEGNSCISIREQPMESPRDGEVLIENIASAISPGTEMHFYRGDLEKGIAVDATLEAYGDGLSYPLRYGYASVGRITAAGTGVDPTVVGRLVFAFTPHASHSCVRAEQALPVPGDIGPEEAAFLANTETAVNLALDSCPLIGERVSVFGLGVVGLLTTGLLARFPLARLSAWDLHPLRRKAAEGFGAVAADPAATPPSVGTEDLAVEVSGSLEGFRMALASCGFNGRLVVGSWYGAGPVQQPFDTRFHRSRVRIIASQVSTIAPGLTGRWTRERRIGAAWEAVRILKPARLITHRFPFSRAADAYRLIADSPGQTLQVMLVHENEGTRRHAP